jgi:cell division protein FtsW (lipid II flippase)
MSTRTKFVIGGVAVGLLTLWILPWWLSALIILGVIGAPVIAYLMLDPSQRRRVRAQGRKRIGP